ncbi:MAG: TRAP transporter small permease subunit [Halieaceae bacterium]|nr:TRAP transporter small permease subunit [Halieaceae bacterium]
MPLLRSAIRMIDGYTERCGLALSWLCLAMTLVTCFVVLLRYGYGIGSIGGQESVTYMHAALFMLGAAFTLKRGGHVRVDIFYRRFTARARAWVDSVGAILFLLPFCIFLIGSSWQFAGDAWAIREVSAESGGIPAIFLLKSLLPLMGFNLALQGIAELLRNALALVDQTA